MEETIKSVKEKNEDLLQNSDLIDSDEKEDNEFEILENDDDKDVSISQDIDNLDDSVDEDIEEDINEMSKIDTSSKDTSSKDTSNKDTPDKDTSAKDISIKETSSKDTPDKDNLDLMFFSVVDNIKKSENKDKQVKNTHKPKLTNVDSIKEIDNSNNDKTGGAFSESNVKSIKLTEKYDFF